MLKHLRAQAKEAKEGCQLGLNANGSKIGRCSRGKKIAPTGFCSASQIPES
jgi:hypothetical protein